MGFQTNGSLDLWVFGPMGRQTYELLGPMIQGNSTVTHVTLLKISQLIYSL